MQKPKIQGLDVLVQRSKADERTLQCTVVALYSGVVKVDRTGAVHTDQVHVIRARRVFPFETVRGSAGPVWPLWMRLRHPRMHKTLHTVVSGIMDELDQQTADFNKLTEGAYPPLPHLKSRHYRRFEAAILEQAKTLAEML